MLVKIAESSVVASNFALIKVVANSLKDYVSAL